MRLRKERELNRRREEEHRRAEERAAESLRHSEARFRSFFDDAPIGKSMTAPDGTFLRVNRAFARMLGYSVEELKTVSYSSLTHADDLAESREGARGLLAGELDTWNMEKRYRAKDGRYVWAHVSTALQSDDEGRPQYFVTHVYDITERKRAEVERSRLAMAVEQAGEAVLITDADGAIVYVNPAFESVTGYSREEVMGRNPRFLKSGVQDAAFYRALWTTVGGGHTWRGRLVNKKKDGTLYSEDSSISPMRDSAGAISSYVAVKRDITATLALEAQFLQAQKMEAIGSLAGGVAHDFNNLLSIILSYSTMLAEDMTAGDPRRADLLEIEAAGKRAVELTRQLLAFSRKQVLQPRVLDLNDVVTGVERMLGRLIGADIHLTVLADPDLRKVRVDPSQIEQVIMNLAVNARDAMPQGGKLTIETANVELDETYAATHAGIKPGPHVMLAVTDSGTGMDKAILARIFEPFFTTKGVGKGTGLGLATVFGIVRQSEGSIWVYSEPGKGTTFKVYLPRARSFDSDAPMPVAAEGAPAGGTETILLVEDEDGVRVLARTILRRLGYHVLDARSGGDALLICEQHTATIDLLLTDVVMPRMSGRQLSERLRPLCPDMKVLFMSGYTDDAIVHHGVLDSGVAFLQKPFTPATLGRRVREVLDAPECARA